MNCTLCVSANIELFQVVGEKKYSRCGECGLIFLQSQYWLTPEQEFKRYQLHQNQPTQGYLDYLTPVIDMVRSEMPTGSRGLDYGCGPDPVLANELMGCGFQMSVWDPYFYNQSEVVDSRREYDFITCTEVIEHLREPAKTFEHLKSLLKQSGKVFLQTQLYRSGVDFKNWHYRRDTTHICFYTTETMAWIRDRYQLPIRQPGL